jgi:hypothetical protein
MSLKKRLLKNSLKSVLSQQSKLLGAGLDSGGVSGASLKTDLEELMRRHADLEDALAQDPCLRAVVCQVQAWQKRRISQTYHRLLSHQALGPATRFVLEEAYAGPNHEALISEIERVAPHVVRLFPAPLVKTACDILNLNSLTLSLDMELAQWLMEHAPEFGTAPETQPPLSEAALSAVLYERAYCEHGGFSRRRYQLDLMAGVGLNVEHYLGNPWVFKAFKVAKLPAKALGLHSLVGFMDSGFQAIHKLPVSASELCALIVETERAYLERMIRGERGVFLPDCQLAKASIAAVLQRVDAQGCHESVAI